MGIPLTLEEIIENIDEALSEALGASDDEEYTEWLETLECGDVHQSVVDFKGSKEDTLHLENYISEALNELFDLS